MQDPLLFVQIDGYRPRLVLPQCPNQRSKTREKWRVSSRIPGVHQVRACSLAESLDKGTDFPADNGLLPSVVVELINAHTVLVGNIPKEAASPKSSIFRGIGDFGQRCLLAKRLVQSGVRFVEVSHNLNFIYVTEWDTHKKG